MFLDVIVGWRRCLLLLALATLLLLVTAGNQKCKRQKYRQLFLHDNPPWNTCKPCSLLCHLSKAHASL